MQDALLASLPLWLAALTLTPDPANAGPAASPSIAAEPAAAAAFSVRTLTLAQALQRSLDRHPLVAARLSELEAAEAAVLQAGARPNPVLETEIEDVRRETRATTIVLAQPIELGGKRDARIAAAERVRDLAQSQLLSARARLRAEIGAAFFDALAAQERVRLAEAALDVSRRASEAAAKRVTAGKVAPIDETKARVAQAITRVELVQAEGELRGKIHALAAALGEVAAFERVDGDVRPPPLLSVPELEARIAASPALRQAELETQRMGALAGVERSKRMPDLTVGVGVKRSQEPGRQQAILTLSMPLPVWDSNRGGEIEALRRQDKARFDAQAEALRLRADAAQARERLQTAALEAETLRDEVLPGAQTAFEAASKGFELGKFAFLDMLDAQRTLLQARAQHLKAIAEAHRAASDIARLLGDGRDADPATAVEQR